MARTVADYMVQTLKQAGVKRVFGVVGEFVGAKGIHVEDPHDLEDALRCAFQHDGPALVDVASARQELILPPKTTPVEAKNFGLFLIKAVLDGRGSQLIDLAETNVLR